MRLALMFLSSTLILAGCEGSPVTPSVTGGKTPLVQAERAPVPEAVREVVLEALAKLGRKNGDFLNLRPDKEPGLYTFHANIYLGKSGGYVHGRYVYGSVRDGKVTIEINKPTRNRPNPGYWGADI